MERFIFNISSLTNNIKSVYDANYSVILIRVRYINLKTTVNLDLGLTNSQQGYLSIYQHYYLPLDLFRFFFYTNWGPLHLCHRISHVHILQMNTKKGGGDRKTNAQTGEILN